MTGLSKAGVCKNASGHFYLSMSMSYIILLCVYVRFPSIFLVFASGYVRKCYFSHKKSWHSDICPVLFLVPATEIEDKSAIYKI